MPGQLCRLQLLRKFVPGQDEARGALAGAADRAGQPAAGPERGDGALPTLYAATAEGVTGGAHSGPLGWGGMRGTLGPVRSSARSYDAVARQLWQVSEDLMGIRYEALRTHGVPGETS